MSFNRIASQGFQLIMIYSIIIYYMKGAKPYGCVCNLATAPRFVLMFLNLDLNLHFDLMDGGISNDNY